MKFIWKSKKIKRKNKLKSSFCRNASKLKMDVMAKLFYEDENHDANINVLCIRRKIRDD